MRKCIRCHKDIDGTPFCPLCGARQEQKQRNTKERGNGTGTAYKRGKTWTAKAIVGWKCNDGTVISISRTKGGFKSKSDALAYCPTLKYGNCVKDNSITFSKLYEQWFPFYEPRVGKSTMNGHKAAYIYFGPIHYVKFQDITASALQDCIDDCEKGKRTKENMKSLAMALYKYAISNDIVTVNHAQYLYCGKEGTMQRDPFTQDEQNRILDSIGKIPYADYVYCLIYTGFRPNEMLSLKKSAYDAENKILVGGFKTEAGRNRPVPVSPKIQTIIDRLMNSESEYIFPKADGTMMDDEYFRKKCFSPLMDALGISGKVPYCCRHTFANLLKNVKGSDTDKAALMGHADASMTKYYQSADYESLQKIVAGL